MTCVNDCFVLFLFCRVPEGSGEGVELRTHDAPHGRLRILTQREHFLQEYSAINNITMMVKVKELDLPQHTHTHTNTHTHTHTHTHIQGIRGHARRDGSRDAK